MPAIDETAVDNALTTTNGHRAKAARILGITESALQNRLFKSSTLKAKWCKQPDTMRDVETLARPGPQNPAEGPSLLTAQEAQRAMELENDRILKEGIATFGLPEDGQQIALALQKFHRKQFRESIEIVASGFTRSAIMLQMEADRVSIRLKEVRAEIAKLDGIHPTEVDPEGPKPKAVDEVRKQWTDEEKGLMECQIQIFAEIRHHGILANEITRTTAKLREGRSGLRSAKPGFKGVVDVEVAA